MADKKNILSEKEARDALRVEDNYPSSLVSFANQTATAYVDERTGFKWESEDTVDGEAKACAALVLQQNFYHDKDHDFTAGIFDYIFELQLKAREKTA